MHTPIEQNDPRSTAATAIVVAADIAKDLRALLPGLLGSRTPGGLGLIADRVKRDPFDPFVIGSLEGVLDQCETAIEAGTSQGLIWVIARSIGGDDEFEPLTVTRLNDEARDLQKFANRVRVLLDLVARTEALLAADRVIDRLR
jgi:hypothetical protein